MDWCFVFGCNFVFDRTCESKLLTFYKKYFLIVGDHFHKLNLFLVVEAIKPELIKNSSFRADVVSIRASVHEKF